MVDLCVLEHLLRVDVLQGESHCRYESTDQSDQVEGYLGEGSDHDTGYYGHETQIDPFGVPFLEDQLRQDDCEEWHRAFH